jgi:hypothetical protein
VGRGGFDPHLPRQERGALPLELPAQMYLILVRPGQAVAQTFAACSPRCRSSAFMTGVTRTAALRSCQEPSMSKMNTEVRSPLTGSG